MGRSFFFHLAQLIFGLFLYATGMAATMRAQIGCLPWDVFHTGLAGAAGVSIGTAIIAAGAVIIALVILFREIIGLGTVLNLLLIGTFLDIILWLDFIPRAGSFLPGLVMLVVGLFLISLGSYFYISAGFGAGPRDSLMVALAKKTKLPIGICRGVVELTALICGWRMGGMVGIGTVISLLACNKPNENKHIPAARARAINLGPFLGTWPFPPACPLAFSPPGGGHNNEGFELFLPIPHLIIK